MARKNRLIIYTSNLNQGKADAARLRERVHTVLLRDERRWDGDCEDCDAIATYGGNKRIEADYAAVRGVPAYDIGGEEGLAAVPEVVEPPVELPDPEPAVSIEQMTSTGKNAGEFHQERTAEAQAAAEAAATPPEQADTQPVHEAIGEAYIVEREKKGWFDVVAPDGTNINDEALRKGPAKAALADFLGE
jgi:hypothetical protein